MPLRRLFGYAAPYRTRMIWAVVSMVLYAIGSAGLAALVKTIFDQVLQDRSELGTVAWAIIGLNVLKGLGSYGSSYLMASVGQRVVTDLRNALYTHILGQSAAFFSARSTGDLMSRISNDVGQVQQAVSETVSDLARETLSVVGFAALEIYSPKLAEIRSLAVDPGYHGRGIGRGLVSRCVQLAVSRNVLEVMAITSSDGFFKACGFDFTLPGEKKALFIQTRDEY